MNQPCPLQGGTKGGNDAIKITANHFSNNLLLAFHSFPVDDYLIFYRPIVEGIEVVWIVSGYRDLEALFSD